MLTELRPADATEREAALRRLGLPADAPTDHLLVARQHGQPVGAVYAELAGDGLAEVRPPIADDAATAEALAATLLDRLRAAGVVVAQCLQPAGADSPTLVRVGFCHVTRLVTLRREPVPPGPRASLLHFTPAPADDPDLVAAFAASLVGSPDLPELTGLRPPAVELAGYPATQRVVARLDGRPVGLSLLAPGELLYLGLAPHVRGGGFGHALLNHALRELGDTTVTVSADARNRPALNLYERHGFRTCRLQEVFLWTARE